MNDARPLVADVADAMDGKRRSGPLAEDEALRLLVSMGSAGRLRVLERLKAALETDIADIEEQLTRAGVPYE